MEMKMQGLVLLVLLCAVAQGRVYTRCEFAKALKDKSWYGFGELTLAQWVCVFEHETNLNSSAIRTHEDGSSDYGVFAFNSKYWCNDGKTETKNYCGYECSAGDKKDVNNYRPISIISVISKTLDKVVSEQLTQHLEAEEVLHAMQFGFRANHSTETACCLLIKFNQLNQISTTEG
ncbi:hypothetical protein WMY93_006249 [Mugilogobius chulae]|uniref:lysozyme n=1 Tax=Mugilogobius chulae TaxID=88201 RepID=A0AAW0PTD4_9GOBI